MTRRLARAAGALALVVVLGACGANKPSATGSSPGATDAATSTTTVAGNADATAFRDCMTQHGVTFPAGNDGAPNFGGNPPGSDQTPPDSTPSDSRGGGFGGPNGSIDPNTQAALQACGSLRPQGGFGGGGNGNGGGGANSQAFQAYLSCLADNGVVVPTTTATNSAPASIDRSSAAFQAANEKCQVLLPQRNGGSTTTSQG